MTHLCALVAVAVLGGSAAADAPRNLLRNGSFEGGLRYWHEADKAKLVRAANAPHGQYHVRIENGLIQSAAFLLTPRRAVTIAWTARADADDAVMGWQCSPCSREVGAQANQTWSLRHHHPIKLTRRWQRYSVTFTPTAAHNGLWPRPTYMVQLGDANRPIELDAVTVVYGPADAYVAYRPVEVQVESPDLRGYRANGNLLDHGADVRLVGHVANPGTEARRLTARWQWVDYEGVRTFGTPVEREVNVPPGQVVSETVTMPLRPRGLVLARFSVVDGDRVVDASDLPVCSLPYPKAATRPDRRERFGGSFFGPHSAALGAQIGFAWSRWYPHMNWADHQPDGPDRWRWFDDTIDALAAKGISVNAVLYGLPKWARDDKSAPLPKDMNWPADDPRWDDLTVRTGWDRFVTEAVRHYRGKSLIYEIENEPEFDGWEKKRDQYVRFTTRTARLIKQTDPKARVMVDNVYGIPSGMNAHLLRSGAAKYIDIISWHDYRGGPLTDALAIRRMRQNLDEAGGKHIEIWFNEGWAYTNTVVDEPAIALLDLSSAASTNAMVSSVAEATAVAQEKTILFHTGYEIHGMSFWDYAGPGTMLWDWYGYPLPLVPAWNTLAHHVGLSERVVFIRPPGCSVCVFDDLRNRRGVLVAYADANAKADALLDLNMADLSAEDVMGNPHPIDGGRLTLPRSGRPVYIWSTKGVAGQAFARRLAPLDRKFQGFADAAGLKFRLPAAWDGEAKGQATGNPIRQGGAPVWRFDMLWPADRPELADSYAPMVWGGTEWIGPRHNMGGQPQARIKDGTAVFGVRGNWSGTTPPGQRTAALVFVAPKAGVYRVSGTARSEPWEGGAKALALQVRKKDAQRAAVVRTIELPRKTDVPLAFTVELSAGHELLFLPFVDPWHNASTITLTELTIEGQWER